MKKILGLAISFVFAASIQAQDAVLLFAASAVTKSADIKSLEAQLSRTPDNFRELYLGIAWHNVAQSDSSQTDTAVALLQQGWDKTKSPLALGYLGSAITLRAGAAATAGNVAAASKDLSDGLSKIDRAVELDPKSQELRILRMVNGLSVSETSPVSRYALIKEDLALLPPQLSSMDANMQALVWYCRGKVALSDNRFDDAYKALETSVRLSPDSAYGKASKRAMWELQE
jgi:tetratricopeptide (TPR) repeat protein